MTREETIQELGEFLEQMIQHGVPSHSAKRKALATAIALLSTDAVQGEWKRVETRTYKGECTNCGFRHIFMDGHDSQYRFCPNCGARMKGGEQNDD